MSTKTKTPVKPLRAQILDFLASRDEATLKQIAAATTERDFPSRVTTELNKMRTDALVECEKKKGKNELWYWLASPSSAVPDSQPAVEQNTGSSAEDASATPASGAAVQPQSAPAAAASLSAAPAAADETDDGDEMPPADAALLALANRELSDRLARVAHVLRGSGLDALKNLDDGADLQSAAAAVTGAYQMAMGGLDARNAKIAGLEKEVSMQDADLHKIRDVLGQRLHIGDPGHLAPPVKCAELAAELIDSLLASNQDNQNLIAIASEKLAEVVRSDIDTSDMDLDELAEHAAAQLADKDTELLEQARLVVDLRTQLANQNALVAKLEHLLQSARNEAEHLRKHAGQADVIDSATLPALLEAAARHLAEGQQLTLLPPGAPGTPVHEDGPEVLIKVFGCHFTAPIGSVNHVLDAATTLQRHERRLF